MQIYITSLIEIYKANLLDRIGKYLTTASQPSIIYIFVLDNKIFISLNFLRKRNKERKNERKKERNAVDQKEIFRFQT